MGWLLSFGLCHKTQGSGRVLGPRVTAALFFTLKQIQLFGFLWRRLRCGGTRCYAALISSPIVETRSAIPGAFVGVLRRVSCATDQRFFAASSL